MQEPRFCVEAIDCSFRGFPIDSQFSAVVLQRHHSQGATLVNRGVLLHCHVSGDFSLHLVVCCSLTTSGINTGCQTVALSSKTPRTIPRTRTLTQPRRGLRCKNDSRRRLRRYLNRQNVAGVQAWCCRSEYKASLWRAGKRASLDLTDSFQNTSSETFWSDSTASPRRSREKLSDCLRFSWRFKYDFLHSSNSDWFTK